MDAKKLSNLGVTTTDGTRFTGEDATQLARLIHKRFGHDDEAATEAWRRMLGNSTPVSKFMELVNHEPEPFAWMATVEGVPVGLTSCPFPGETPKNKVPVFLRSAK